VAAAPPAPRDQLDPREAARRLARVMVSSIEGGDRNDEGAGLATAIDEARELFQSCVLPELAYMFEEALAQRGLLTQKARPVPPAPPPPPKPVQWAGEATAAVEPITSGDATDRVVIEDLTPPVEEVTPPVERYEPPVQRFDPPLERFDPPLERFDPPVERFDPPIERHEPIAPLRLASPEDDLPTHPRPQFPEPEPVRAPPAKASSVRLAILAAAITATSMGVAYYLLMAR
jgi:hypothetical protein